MEFLRRQRDKNKHCLHPIHTLIPIAVSSEKSQGFNFAMLQVFEILVFLTYFVVGFFDLTTN